MQQLEPLALKITGSVNGLSSAIAKAEADIKKFTSFASKQASNVAFNGPSVGQLFAGVGAAAGLKSVVDLSTKAEQAAISFEVLTGSAGKAEKMIKELRDLGASTPLNFAGLQENAKVMLGFGIAVENILPDLRTLGDITGGDAFKMERLTLAFSQSAAAGRLMGQDLLQMVNAGFNPLQIISEKTGVSMSDLRKKMEEGAISFEQVRQAFKDATSDGGRFFQMLERQSNTTAGKIGIAVDSVQKLATQIGNVLAPSVAVAATELTEFIRSMESISANDLKAAAGITAAVVAFGAFVSIAPKVIGAIKAIAQAQAAGLALAGPKGWLALAGGLAAAGAASYATGEVFDRYTKSVERANAAQLKAYDSTKLLADQAKKLQDVQQLAQNKAQSGFMAAGGSGDLEVAKARIDEIGMKLANANVELRESEKRMKAAFAAADVADLSEKLQGLNGELSRLNAQGVGFTGRQSVVAQIKETEAALERLKKVSEGFNFAGDPNGKGFNFAAGDALEGVNATKEKIAQLEGELSGLNSALEANSKYWKELAATTEKLNASPLEKYQSAIENLAEQVRLGGLSMKAFDAASKEALETLLKAGEAKENLSKPTFANIAIRGSNEDIEAQFNHRFGGGTLPAEQLETQREANRILTDILTALRENRPVTPPTAKF